MGEGLWSLLPMFPWEGPPLPRAMGITWLSLALGAGSSMSPGFTSERPVSSYNNEEQWSIAWTEEGLPSSVTVHRNAERR